MATLAGHFEDIQATAEAHRKALRDAGIMEVNVACFLCGRTFTDLNGAGVSSPATYALERHLIDDHRFYSWHDKQLAGAGHHANG